MKTIIIDDRSTGAKKIIEYLKTLPYAKIIEDRTPGPSLRKSMAEAREGKVTHAKNAADLLDKLKR